MANPVDQLRSLRQQQQELKDKIGAMGDMRPGSLVGRFRKCGKANCHCGAKGAQGHGPSWSLTRDVEGKTVTKIIPATAVDRTTEQIAEHRRFRSLARELVEVSEQICDVQLHEPEAASQEVAKKRGSKKPSTPRSSPK